MATVDLLVVPSLNAPIGRTLIEAMSLGTVVVATNHGGNPEPIVNGKTGFLVDSEDIGAFVPRTHRMISDPAALEQIRSATLAESSATYKPESHLRGIIDVSRSLFQRINRRRH